MWAEAPIPLYYQHTVFQRVQTVEWQRRQGWTIMLYGLKNNVPTCMEGRRSGWLERRPKDTGWALSQNASNTSRAIMSSLLCQSRYSLDLLCGGRLLIIFLHYRRAVQERVSLEGRGRVQLCMNTLRVVESRYVVSAFISFPDA